MTLHIHYDHQCPRCDAYYIPYDQDVPCPKCGEVEKARFDYISEAACSMQVNMNEYGCYQPPAWWIGSLADHILSVLFGLFGSFEADGGRRDFEEYLTDQLGQMQWGDQEYLRDHVRGIALRVRQELQKEAPEARRELRSTKTHNQVPGMKEAKDPLEEEAIKYFEELEKSADALRLLEKGNRFLKLGEFNEALGVYDRALQVYAKEPQIWYYKGYCLGKVGRHEEALRCFEKAVELDPQDSWFLYSKGVALSDLGHVEAALGCFEKVLELDPVHSYALHKKRDLLGMLGRIQGDS